MERSTCSIATAMDAMVKSPSRHSPACTSARWPLEISMVDQNHELTGCLGDSVPVTIYLPSGKLTVRPWQIGFERLVSIKTRLFAESMLIYQRVSIYLWIYRSIYPLVSHLILLSRAPAATSRACSWALETTAIHIYIYMYKRHQKAIELEDVEEKHLEIIQGEGRWRPQLMFLYVVFYRSYSWRMLKGSKFCLAHTSRNC